jgi:two-component system chemotaxis sensor kinase CheA
VEPLHKYLPLFVAEAGEQLQELSRELLRLEAEELRAPLWDAIFRRAHSVKGSAATLGLTAIVDIAHAAEALIGRLKLSQARPGKAEVDLLLEAADALVAQVRSASLAAGGAALVATPGAAEAVAQLTARLFSAAAALEAADPQKPAPPKLPPAPVADPGLPRLRISVQLAPTCVAPGARAMVLERKLKKLGALLELYPTPAQLSGRKDAPPLRALLSTASSAEEVRAACLSVPEVEHVSVEALSDPPALSGDPGAAPEARPDATVRVRADALDSVLDGAGELLLGIARLRESARKLPEAYAGAFEADVDKLRRQARELHGRVMTARLTPFSALTERLPRAVRDLSHRLGKDVELEVRGAEVELDRAAVEALADPLIHLVRNAVDHGIELPEERAAAGKPPRGRVVVTASRERDRVLVVIEDDGRGLSASALRERAVRDGAISAEEALGMDSAAAYQLAFLPGVSTRAEATDVSGRGVGLDAVHRAVEALGGKIALQSAPSAGAKFTLQIPLAVSVAQVLLVQVGGEIFGLPLHKIILTTEYDLSARGGEGFESRSLVVAGRLVRAYALDKLFGLPSLAPPGPRPFLVLDVDGVRFALSVDKLVGQEEVVMKPLFPPLDRVRGLSGMAVLANGRPLLVLDPRGLHELATPPEAAPPATPPDVATLAAPSGAATLAAPSGAASLAAPSGAAPPDAALTTRGAA